MEFLLWCKDRYLEGNTPSNQEFRQTSKYSEVKDFVKELVASEGLEKLYNYTMESQYLVNLWTAHLILELFDPDENIKGECLKIIERYSNGRLNKKVAEEETKWLENYSN